MKVDCLVVGAGPAGSIIAKEMASYGYDVLVLEKRQEIGAPKRCAEGITKHGLEKLGIELHPLCISRKIKGLAKAMKLLKYIDEEKMPEGINVKGLIRELLGKRDRSTLAKFHWQSLYIGTMHFQDLYNYDIQRVMRCGIHYVTPDGRIIPFCAYNTGPTYREEVEKRFSIPLEEWRKKYGESGL